MSGASSHFAILTFDLIDRVQIISQDIICRLESIFSNLKSKTLPCQTRQRHDGAIAGHCLWHITKTDRNLIDGRIFIT